LAGVEARALTEVAEMSAASDLLAQIWGHGEYRPMTPELLRALAAAGNYVAGVFAGGRLVGVCVAFGSMVDRGEMHSHIAGVTPGLGGRGAGFALKLHQRAWALDRGVRAVEWTFDPLVARNAHFNLVKLGADAPRYLPDFYGPMSDAINAGDSTDRLLVHWELAGAKAVAAARGLPATLDDAGATLPRGGVRFVAVPSDIEAMRRSDPAGARAWRVRLSRELAPAMAAGARIVGFDARRGYALSRSGGAESSSGGSGGSSLGGSGDRREGPDVRGPGEPASGELSPGLGSGEEER
jgi:predicted GNAT superfamily acetyltransferase